MPQKSFNTDGSRHCARCKRYIKLGALYTWGRNGRFFHGDPCPWSEPRYDATPPGLDPIPPGAPGFHATPAPKVENFGAMPHGLGALLEEAIARTVATSAQASALEAIRGEVESLRKTVAEGNALTITVKRWDGATIEVKGAHKLLPRLLRRIQIRKNVYLWGLPGSGKSTAAKQAADALGLRYGYISLNPQTPDSRLLGYMDLAPGEETARYRGTVFFECYTQGGVFCIDELDNASASLLTTLNGMIENGHGAFPCGVMPRHPDFVLVATGNTNGNGGDVLFPERRVFDAAFKERFLYLNFPYDLGLERDMVMSRNALAPPWMEWVRAARDFAAKEHIRIFFSPRCSRDGAELLLDADTSIEDIAEECAFRGIAPDIKARILQACPLPKDSGLRPDAV